MGNYIGIKEASEIIHDIYLNSGISIASTNVRTCLKHRKEKTIVIQAVTLKWKKVGRRICVNKTELQKESYTVIKKLQKQQWLKEHGTLKQRADAIHGQFVSFTRGTHPGDQWEEYFCIKCEKRAKTKSESKECHLCSDWNGCGRNCKLSHLICENCGTTQKMPVTRSLQ